MLTPEYMQQIVDRYLVAINAGDMAAVMALYADDASVEDPVGTEPKRGDEILQFYTNAFSGGAKVELTGPVRISAKAAAFPFRAEITRADGPVIIVEVIDIFEFDPAGKIAKMTAHFGPANITAKDG
ncbi:MAG: steroid delta-isomerase [Sphingomonadales bacterium]|nr:steroid delta-isomerase [Sphingomonadales bacterium]PIX67624.1 MAG: steroid delta-isomerase [Sphingomonadales bacterium CG_4_10_14_3_um_filter_58_15]NCO49822.1 steroid delta-isomerase [Sphingomonadales bacterium]NCO98633.1 steroid delta-isomerase [Sphingomonadales bacterium]NCP26313.1 steroid delta-isomerase [Sphingomonadales bacterium]